MAIDPVATAIDTGFKNRSERIYPLRAALPVADAKFSLGESRSVLDLTAQRVGELSSALCPWPEIGPFDATEYAADLQADPTIDEYEFNRRMTRFKETRQAAFERDTRAAEADRDSARPAALALVADFAMHATAADLSGKLYADLNDFLAEVGLTRIDDLDDRSRARALAVIAAR